MEKNLVLSGRYFQYIDRLTRSTILFGGLVILAVICAALYFGIMIPIRQHCEDMEVQKLSLLEQTELFHAEELKRETFIIKSAELPTVVGSLNNAFLSQGLTIEEIIIPPFASSSMSRLSQNEIKVTVTGEVEKILNVLQDLQKNGPYPLILEEIEFSHMRAQINYKILVDNSGGKDKSGT